MKRLVVFLIFCSCFLSSSEAAQPEQDCRARPEWARPGFVCEPTPCVTRSTVALEECGAQLTTARAQRPRWFRPFLEAGASWSVIDQAAGVYGEGGVVLWRHVNVSAEVTQGDVRGKVGFRREW